MLLYRTAQTQFARDLSGTGSFLFGGRWNTKGSYLLYAAENPSLSFLEYLAHLPSWPSPVSTSLVVIEVPVLTIGIVDLSHQEMNLESTRSKCQEVGNAFIREADFPLLKVPSALIPGDFNFLLNPNHPELANRMVIKEIRTFLPDERIWKQVQG